ncbi:hypothetical protein LINPERHAP1_LOCUS6694 [Linum perenne]
MLCASYSMNLGICSITRVELRAQMWQDYIPLGRKGTERYWCSWIRVLRSSFCWAMARFVHQHSSEVASFCETLDRNWMVKSVHVYREGSRPTYYLDGLGHSLPLGVHSIDVFVLIPYYHSILCMTYLEFSYLV